MPSGRKAKDLTAQRFGLLYVTGRSVRRKRHAVWLCWCDCGRIKHAQSDKLAPRSKHLLWVRASRNPAAQNSCCESRLNVTQPQAIAPQMAESH